MLSPVWSAHSRPASDAAVPLVRASPVPRVGLEARADGEGAGEVARVEVGQEAPVQVAVLPHRRGVLLRDGPADVVVTAHVGDPAAARRARAACASACW